MTTEYFEQQIKKFKEEGKLPGDFEIVEVELMFGNRFVSRALGYAKGKKIVNENKEEVQTYRTFVWTYYVGGLICSENTGMPPGNDRCLSVIWNEEANRPEFIEALHPWLDRRQLDIREP